MNPQFQNMMGMGRGMPNGNMQQMNANNTSQQLQRHILQTLQREGPWSGWQAEVSMNDRVMQIRQLVDSLRLLGPPVELHQAVDVALKFESNQFAEQPTKEDYLRECAEKLSKIRDQRQQQIRAQHMNGGQMGMVNQNFQQQQQLQQQLQQAQMRPSMQASTMGTANPAMAQMQTLNQSQAMGQMNQMNRMNQIPMQQMANPQSELTQEDNQIINRRAAELARSTPKEEMPNIVERMDPRLRQNLAQKGIDSIIYHFRMLATREYRAKQAMSTQMNNANNMGLMAQMANGQQNNANAAMVKNMSQPGGAPFISNLNQIQSQQEAGWKSAAEGQTVVPASNNPNMSADQLRIQQQMLANQRLNQQNPQLNREFLAQQQMVKNQLNQSQQQQQSQPQQTPQQQQQQQQQHHHQQQQRLQQAQMQAQQNQARAQAAAGQGGNVSNVGQQMANMNVLNRPVGPVMQNGSPQPQRPQSRQPIPGQQQQQQSGPNQMATSLNQLQQQIMQSPQAFLARLPIQMQNVIRSKPASEWAAFIIRWRQSQNQNQNAAMQRNISQQMAQQTGQQQAQAMANGQILGASASLMQPTLSSGQPGQPGTVPINNAQNTGQQQPQNPVMAPNPEMLKQRQHLLLQAQQQQRMTAGQQQGNNSDIPRRPLSQQELAMMDRQPIYPQFIKQLQSVLAAQNVIVPEFQSWLQLKQWFSQNPQQRINIQNILVLQANQFHFEVKRRQQQQQANANANAQLQGAQLQQLQRQQSQQAQQSQPTPQQPTPQQPSQQATPQQQSQQMSQLPPSQTPQNVAPTMGQMAGGMSAQQIQPITDQDIQRVRQQHPKIRDMSDDAIRRYMVEKIRARHLQQQQQQQGMMQMGQGQQPFVQQLNQAQTMGQMPAQRAQVQPQQALVQNQQVPQTQAQNRQIPKAPNQQPNQSNVASQNKLKRPNQDENNETQLQNQGPTKPPMADPGKLPSLTKEQFEKLNDAEKTKYMAMMKQRQRMELQRRIAEFSKHVQSQLPQLRPIMNMDPGSRKRINTYLTYDTTKNMLNRFDPFLLAYCSIENNETTIKQLMSNRNLLIAQYKPSTVADKSWEPADNFSITADNVESIINNMSAKFQQTMAKQAQRPQQSLGQQQQGQLRQSSPTVPQRQQRQQQGQQQLPLTAENLNLAQAQALQQSKKGQKSKDIPPAAPIATEPPFQIGDNRGQGAPRYAPNPTLKQEDLKLDPKRRKKNPGSTTTPTAMVASPDVTHEQKPALKQYKCNFRVCEFHSIGFATREELKQHSRVAHRPEMEPVTDPQAFLGEALMQVFGLDEKMQSIKKPEPSVVVVVPMQKTVSKAGSNLRIESKPSTPTPMARGLSQQQLGKTNVPATPNMLKTPQSLKAELKVATPKPFDVKEEPDMWANSNFDLDTLRDTFGDVEWSDVMPTLDPEQIDLDECIQTYMRSEDWQKVMNGGAVPSSSEGSTDKSKSPTDKSKSPGDGNEPSASAGDAAKQDTTTKQSSEIDLLFGDIDISPDGFEDLLMTESQGQEMGEDSWEKIERPSPENKQDLNSADPFASLDDPELDAWSKPLYEPLQANGFPDTDSPFEPIDLDEFVANNGPEVWAAGSMAWNAIGETGERLRKDLGWPIEGAHGLQA